MYITDTVRTPVRSVLPNMHVLANVGGVKADWRVVTITHYLRSSIITFSNGIDLMHNADDSVDVIPTDDNN